MICMRASTVAAAILLAASPAAAQTRNGGSDQADMQCIAVFSVTAADESLTQDQRDGLAMGLIYYLGRLQGRSPSVDWYQRLTGYLLDVEVKDLEPHFERCAAEFEAQGRELEAWSAALDSKVGGKS